jgi:uncharacterized protein
MLRIVLDTNVLVASISRKSPFHWVWQSFVNGNYILCITTDILDEYAEIIERFFSAKDAEYVLTQIVLQKNVAFTVRYFEWNIMEKDPDDNKFFDCAVAANADFIVSEDKHFNVLRDIAFPSVIAIKTVDFKDIMNNL